jgi:hypothetical protein
MARPEQEKNTTPIDLETGSNTSNTSGEGSKKDDPSPPPYQTDDTRTASSVAQEDGAEIDLTPLSWW